MSYESAQRAYDRMEPDWGEDVADIEPEYVRDANDLTDREIRDFVDAWLNDETANDETSLEYMTIYAWFKDYPLSHDLQTWAKKWARQAAFEAQLPANLKRQASIN